MTSVYLFALLTVALLAALYWLSQRARRDPKGSDLLRTLTSDALLPQHYKYFPQVSRALSAEDARFLQSRASPTVRRAALHARRTVALQFLVGLRDDYQKLDHWRGYSLRWLPRQISNAKPSDSGWLFSLHFDGAYCGWKYGPVQRLLPSFRRWRDLLAVWPRKCSPR